jgi:hypothetical protein
MKLPRPYIPISVRLFVAERQFLECGITDLHSLYSWRYYWRPVKGNTEKLEALLTALFGKAKVELHHRPALLNRERTKKGGYIPDANDPDYLVYLPVDDHDIETRVRGQHGQHSDLGLARKNKRKAKKLKAKKRKWPSRPFPSARDTRWRVK